MSILYQKKIQKSILLRVSRIVAMGMLGAVILAGGVIYGSTNGAIGQAYAAKNISDQDQINQNKLIKQVEDYLQSLIKVQANFVQTTPQGNQISGVFYLKRPGRLRFDYAGIDDFVVADGQFIYFYDAELGAQSNAPIGQTLAHFLLRKDISLDKGVSVSKLIESEDAIIMTLAQDDDPEAGSMTLFFDKDNTKADKKDAPPITLSQWIVRDAQGDLTKVDLSRLTTNLDSKIDFPDLLFVYRDPKTDKPALNE